MNKNKTFYITTSIPYANAVPHIGHALEFLYGDAVARYHYLLGQDVFLLIGADEHGQKIYKTAKDAGITVDDLAKEKSVAFERLTDEWGIINNDFIRTTDARHIVGATKFWEKAMANGDIYKKQYSGHYCVGCERFVTEKDLVEGLCPIHQKKPELVEEENYFFKLSNYQEALEFLYQENSGFVFPNNRYQEMKNILSGGLEDVSISRDKNKLPWGIPVPGDDSQVMYVWFDALTNYITALGFGSENQKLFDKYWPAQVQVVGKDINRFHSLLWPAMLMSVGLELPKQIAVHGFITSNGQKMSKSLGNVIDPEELTKKYPLDAVRYFLLREFDFAEDGDFTYKKFEERYNADLANGLGNLVNRIMVMIEKYCDNHVPEVKNIDDNLIAFVGEINKKYNENILTWRFDRALENVWQLITRLDQTISDKKPWEMVKQNNTGELNDLLYHLLEALRHVAINIWPFIPGTSEKILIMLGLNMEKELAKPLSDLQQWAGLEVGSETKKADVLFPRI
jgi:methionyl-tRNA synthetase